LANATQKVIDHVKTDHPDQAVFTPEAGVVFEDVRFGAANEDSSDVPSKVISLMLTVSANSTNAAVAYNMLGALGHDLLQADFDFNISKSSYDPFEPLPPLPGDVPCMKEHLVNDEFTMDKVQSIVYAALRSLTAIEESSLAVLSDAIINNLHNNGILFRELP